MVEGLAQAPWEFGPEAQKKPLMLELPGTDGARLRVWCVVSPVMEDSLAMRYPGLRTFGLVGVEDPGLRGRLSLSPNGLHGLWRRGGEWFVLEPHPAGGPAIYRVYGRSGVTVAGEAWTCMTVTAPLAAAGGEQGPVSSGEVLRLYRLALAATGEWTAAHGGTVKSAMAALVILVNQLNAIYESEASIRFILVGQNDRLVFTNAATDPYTGSDPAALLDQNQATIDRWIGDANYDVGHVLSRASGGLATLSSVCRSGLKARGHTGVGNSNDPLFVDYLAHEIAHQFGATHTFNGVRGACGSHRDAATAYEPGSGSTLMGYAGNCQGDNVQFRSDLYFHAASLGQIVQGASGWPGSSCAMVRETRNHPPIVQAPATAVIPRGTAFELSAQGSDPDGDPLLFGWEQMDLGPAATLDHPDTSQGPLFRSLRPSPNPVRMFPSLERLLQNEVTWAEKLPQTGRTMRFRVTARDSRGGVGGADTVVTVAATVGPFRLRAPNGGENWSNRAMVIWDVAGTTELPVQVSHVNLWLSTNNGRTYPHPLALQTPNDGAEFVDLPSILTTLARVKVEAIGQPFFDISDGPFTITPLEPTPVVAIGSIQVLAESCQPLNGAVDPGEQVTVGISLQNQSVTPASNLVASLLTSGGVMNPGPPQTYGSLIGGQMVTRPFTFTAAGRCGDPLVITLELRDGSRSLGVVSRTLGLGEVRTQVIQRVNSQPLRIPAFGTEGPASVYPSMLVMSGLTGRVARARVTLTGLTHSFAGDLDILLVPPAGRPVWLMSDCGNGTNVTGTLTFDDAAVGSLPVVGAVRTGTNRPTAYDPESDGGLAGAVPGPYSTELASVNGLDPNGVWALYIWDDAPGDTGELSFGWRLELTLTQRVCCGSVVRLPPMLSEISDQATDEDLPIRGIPVEIQDPDTPLDQVWVWAYAADPSLVAPTGLVVRGVGSRRVLDVYPVTNAYGSTWIFVVADDGAASVTNFFRLTVRPVNDPPVLEALPEIKIHAGMLLVLTVAARDVETPATNLRYSLVAPVPDGMSLDPDRGILRWQTLEEHARRVFELLVTVTDDHVPPATTAQTIRVVVKDRPTLRLSAAPNGSLAFEWETLPGTAYVLEATDDLANPRWTAVGQPNVAADGALQVVMSPESAASRFFRVRVVPGVHGLP